MTVRPSTTPAAHVVTSRNTEKQMNTNEPIIVAKEVRKSFPLAGGERVEILHGIDLAIARGEFVAIMGASGSGKSTLLYALCGIDPPSSGSIVVDGVDLAALDQRELEAFRLHRVGFVFQQPLLLDGLSLRENVLLPAVWPGRDERERRIAQTEQRMGDLGVADVADRDAAALSGGQRQRAGIARALVNDPIVLFADEPTGALDSGSAEMVLEILSGLHRGGLTIVMVTHAPEVAARADRIVRVVDGRLAEE